MNNNMSKTGLRILVVTLAIVSAWKCLVEMKAMYFAAVSTTSTTRASQTMHSNSNNSNNFMPRASFHNNRTSVGVTSLLYNQSFSLSSALDTANSAPDLQREQRPLPLPLQVLEQYKVWHSVDVLRRDTAPHQRKFAVVLLACPLQAGNRLHHYLSGMLWSILTNRTMLYKYLDATACKQFSHNIHRLPCNHMTSQEEDCNQVLERASWIPSYDEWSKQLNLSSPIQLPFYATHPRSMTNPRYPWGSGNDEHVIGVDVNYNDTQVVAFCPVHLKITHMSNFDSAQTLLLSQWSRNINIQLHDWGVDYLFGMLLRHSFSLTNTILMDSIPSVQKDTLLRLPSTSSSSPASHNNATNHSHHPLDVLLDNRKYYYTIAIHSRHNVPSSTGCDVSNEQYCIKELQRQMKSKRCVVTIMSDRECTIERLTAWLQQQSKKCTVLIANHRNESDYSSEHGPFAGVGFYQDMALATTVARSAFIGTVRSSSDLIRELIVYNKYMEDWYDDGHNTNTNNHTPTPIDLCIHGSGSSR